MFATIYIYVLLFEFQNMFATIYGCSSFDELLRSKVKMEKKVKKHYDHISSTSIKNAPRGAWSSRGKDDVEMKFAV